MTEYNDEYQTSDLGLAAALSMKINLIRIEKEDPRRAVFVFKDGELLRELEDDYWTKKLQVNPREYFDAIKTLKSRLYN